MRQWQDRDYLIALNMVSGIAGRRMTLLQEAFGSFARVWQAAESELACVPGLPLHVVQQLVAARPSIDPYREQQRAAHSGAHIVTWLDSTYPPWLHHISAPPPVLYVLGQEPRQLGAAVVGTRRPTASGRRQAFSFARSLAKAGVVVISGLARGIDKRAHEGALAAAGTSIAVLGSSLDQIYPAEHRSLVERLAASGCVITEFPFRSPTMPGNFPRRNRLISALAIGVLVVEAGERSGALNTAHWAAEHGRDVWAIPGDIASPTRRGCHALLREGAFLVESPEDVLDQVGDRIATTALSMQPTKDLNREHASAADAAIMELHSRGYSREEIVVATGLTAAIVSSRLLALEVDGWIKT